MSKAFTKEDADAGFDAPPPTARLSESRLTAYGARLMREKLEHSDGAAGERLRGLLHDAEVIEPAGAEHVALGARVRVSSDEGPERVVVIVTPDEVGVVPSAISAASPLAQALIGAKVGDIVELELPRGAQELKVESFDWPA